MIGMMTGVIGATTMTGVIGVVGIMGAGRCADIAMASADFTVAALIWRTMDSAATLVAGVGGTLL